MKVFDGNEFLATSGCEINLSNGRKYVVKDLTDAALERIINLNEDSPLTEIRGAITSALQASPEDLKDVGIIELQAALNFLSESLFTTDSPNVMTLDSQKSAQ